MEFPYLSCLQKNTFYANKNFPQRHSQLRTSGTLAPTLAHCTIFCAIFITP